MFRINDCIIAYGGEKTYGINYILVGVRAAIYEHIASQCEQSGCLLDKNNRVLKSVYRPLALTPALYPESLALLEAATPRPGCASLMCLETAVPSTGCASLVFLKVVSPGMQGCRHPPL